MKFWKSMKFHYVDVPLKKHQFQELNMMNNASKISFPFILYDCVGNFKIYLIPLMQNKQKMRNLTDFDPFNQIILLEKKTMTKHKAEPAEHKTSKQKLPIYASHIQSSPESQAIFAPNI